MAATTAEAALLKEPGVVTITAPAALVSGQVVELADGRAGVVAGLAGFASGDLASIQTEGIFTVQKTASVVLLDGQEIWWVRSTNKASYTGDFILGTAVGDVTAAATTVNVQLNARVVPRIDLATGEWVHDATNGLGVTQINNSYKLAFDAVAEAAQAALHSIDTVDVDDGPIFEAWVAVYDIGDDVVLDMDIGLASATHATDFELIAAFVSLHWDGAALSITAQSDDGTTDVAAVDTTVDAVDDTYLFMQIDCRTKSDIQIYINGVNVLPATVFTLAAYTSTLKAIALIEKSGANDTTADLRVKAMHVRCAGLNT